MASQKPASTASPQAGHCTAGPGCGKTRCEGGGSDSQAVSVRVEGTGSAMGTVSACRLRGWSGFLGPAVMCRWRTTPGSIPRTRVSDHSPFAGPVPVAGYTRPSSSHEMAVGILQMTPKVQDGDERGGGAVPGLERRPLHALSWYSAVTVLAIRQVVYPPFQWLSTRRDRAAGAECLQTGNVGHRGPSPRQGLHIIPHRPRLGRPRGDLEEERTRQSSPFGNEVAAAVNDDPMMTG
ncbi:hypothetical protein PISL3812_09883 [Talaromyces islandicus]|uniref:Uncharacterized protein n=1 Tax=Talaromyces islandicus TaxID=28573 RepID=A0A0U1MB17_TALIS|nr:hypothetical protein PISL3812_09883 [Talaromyces islandicus]